MRPLFFFLALCAAPVQAGYTPPPEHVLIGDALPSRPDEQPRCSTSGDGISDAANVARYSRILKEKAARLDQDARSCVFDGDSIMVVRTSTGFTTSIGGVSVLIYSSSETAVNRLVMAKGGTWTPPVCPPSTVEAIMNEQLRRVFACYSEPGHRVTTRAEDAAVKVAVEAAGAEEARRMTK